MPARTLRRELDCRLGNQFGRQDVRIHIFKTLFYLSIWHSGALHLLHSVYRLLRLNRAAILVYHRVNDLTKDSLTTSVERFAEHMIALREYYSVIPTSTLVDTIRTGGRLPDNAVVIHFDDCYQDVHTNAARILAQLRFPATCFITSGHIGTESVFPHDEQNYPIQLENLRSQDVIGLVAHGFEIGSHTINHVDLGQSSPELASREVTQSKIDLEKLAGKPVRFIAYPFGQRHNMRRDVVECIREAGYDAIFSAYGGYVHSRSNLLDLHRCGMSGEYRPLDLIMVIEGLSLAAIKGRVQSVLDRWKRRHPGTGRPLPDPQGAIHPKPSNQKDGRTDRFY